MTGLPVHARRPRRSIPSSAARPSSGSSTGTCRSPPSITAAARGRRRARTDATPWCCPTSGRPPCPPLVADGRAVNHQWSKGEEFERAFGDLVLATLGPGLSVFSYLRPRTRAVGLAAVRRVSPGTTAPSAAATEPSTRTRRSASTIGAAGATSAASSTWSSPPSWTAQELVAVFAGREPLEDPANEARFRALLGTGYRGEALRVRGGHRRVPRRHAPGGTAGGPPWHRDPAPPARRVGRSHARAPADRRGPARAAGHPPHPGALCADRSPGPRSLTRRSASGASASKAGPASAGSASMGRDAGAGRRRRRPRRSTTGSRCWPRGRVGSTALAPLRRRRQEPGHQPLPARGGAARGGRGRRLRRSRPLHGGGGSGPRGLHHRHQGQEHHDGTGRAPPDRARLPRPRRRQHRSPAVGSLAGAGTRLLDRRDLELPGPRPATARPGSLPSPPWRPITSTGTARSSATTPTSSRCAPSQGWRWPWPTARTTSSAPTPALLGPHLRWVTGAEVAEDAAWSRSLGLTGPHNAAQRRAGAGRPRRAWGSRARPTTIASPRRRWGSCGLPSRCRSLGSVGAVEFVDDSLSTNVLPARAALEAFAGRPVALLVGGHDRGPRLRAARAGHRTARRRRRSW